MWLTYFGTSLQEKKFHTFWIVLFNCYLNWRKAKNMLDHNVTFKWNRDRASASATRCSPLLMWMKWFYHLKNVLNCINSFVFAAIAAFPCFVHLSAAWTDTFSARKMCNAIHQLIEAAHGLPTDCNRIDLSQANVIASRVDG